jgi:hypothetical protein
MAKQRGAHEFLQRGKALLGKALGKQLPHGPSQQQQVPVPLKQQQSQPQQQINVTSNQPRAYPVNWRQTVVQSNLRFGFQVAVAWDSSDGKLASLSNVRVAEIVIYPQPRRPFQAASNIFANGSFWNPLGIYTPGVSLLFPSDGKVASTGQGEDKHVMTKITTPCPDVQGEVNYVVQQQYVYWYADKPDQMLPVPGGKFQIEYKFVQHYNAQAKRYVWCIYTTKRGLGNSFNHTQREYGGDYS